MKNYPYDFSVIGGDMRLWYLAEYLVAKGYRVCIYGAAVQAAKFSCDQASSLKEAVESAAAVIGPVPLTRKNNQILHTGGLLDMSVTGLTGLLKEEQVFFGGCIPDEMKIKLSDAKVKCFDFMEEDSITVYNSIATAEGVIAEAVINWPANLHDSRALVLGYGRCAKTLAAKLKGLTKETHVCARSQEQLAMAAAFGFSVLTYEELEEKIADYDLIFNSVPQVVLGETLLQKVKQNSMILDIATSPGGVDYAAAKELSVKAGIYPGLPGKYAPKASGEALASYVLQMVK